MVRLVGYRVARKPGLRVWMIDWRSIMNVCRGFVWDCNLVSSRIRIWFKLRRGGMSSPAAESALVLEVSAAAKVPYIPVQIFFLRASNRLLTNSMGLLMDDIHTPTVPSGPTTGQGVANGVDKEKLSLMDLIAEKTRVEEELTALGSVLDSVCYDPQYHHMTLTAANVSFCFTAWRQYEPYPDNLRRLPTR